MWSWEGSLNSCFLCKKLQAERLEITGLSLSLNIKSAACHSDCRYQHLMPSLLTYPISKVLRNLYEVEALIFLYCAYRISEVLLINQQVNYCFAFPVDQCIGDRQCFPRALAGMCPLLLWLWMFRMSADPFSLPEQLQSELSMALPCTLVRMSELQPRGSSAGFCPVAVVRLCCLDKYKSRWKWRVNYLSFC